uniref:C2H2-type domain-containing protein n=1 Tax=Lates calcarifer TaxID=8187 RepID=A0A4W6DXE0_LATCA
HRSATTLKPQTGENLLGNHGTNDLVLEDDEEKVQTSLLHQTQTVENKESEPPASSSAQQMETDSSDSETEYSNDEQKETKEPQPVSTFVKHNEVHVIVEKCHCSIGKKTFKCSECGKKFSLKGSLQRHIRVHTGEKPFSCSVCGKKFGRKQHLQEHVIIHTGEQPFSCTVCGKKFRYKAGMRKHMRAHTECECGKMLNQSEMSPTHMTGHGYEKALNCSQQYNCHEGRIYCILKCIVLLQSCVFFFLKETWGLVHLNQKPYTNLHLNTSYRKYFYGRYVFQGMIYGLRGTHVLTDVSV